MIILDLYLVRHGQSWGQTSTLDDMPPDCETGLLEFDWRLTPLGQRQAALLGESLAQSLFDMIFCSPLERARATAQAVIERQPKPVPVIVMHELMEIGNYGNETPEEFHARALRVAAAIREQSPTGARILIAAHGGLNNLLLGAFLGVPMWENPFRFGQDNTGLSRIVFHGEDVPEWERVRLHRMNDLSHLTPDVCEETIRGNIKELYQ